MRYEPSITYDKPNRVLKVSLSLSRNLIRSARFILGRSRKGKVQLGQLVTFGESLAVVIVGISSHGARLTKARWEWNAAGCRRDQENKSTIPPHAGESDTGAKTGAV